MLLNSKLISKICFFFSFIIFFSISKLQAQSEMGEAIITLRSGEVLSSLTQVDPDEISLVTLKNGSGEKEMLSISEIKSIRFSNGSKYVTMPLNNQASAPLRLFKSIVESKSQISLYVRWEPAKTLYVSKGDSIYRLENNERIIEKSAHEPNNAGRSGNYKTYDYSYAKLLGVLMRDRYELSAEIQSSDLTEKDITRLILMYNKGEVSYHLSSSSRLKSPPNHLVYGQAALVASFLHFQSPSLGGSFTVGWQFYPRSNGRFSTKMGFYHSNFQISRYSSWLDKTYPVDISTTGLTTVAQFEFIKRSKIQSYIAMRIFDVVQFSENDNGYKETTAMLIPRFSPSLGIQFMLSDRLAIYGEINHLMQLNRIFKNVGLGVSYDFGEQSRF